MSTELNGLDRAAVYGGTFTGELPRAGLQPLVSTSSIDDAVPFRDEIRKVLAMLNVVEWLAFEASLKN